MGLQLPKEKSYTSSLIFKDTTYTTSFSFNGQTHTMKKTIHNTAGKRRNILCLFFHQKENLKNFLC